MQKSIETFDLLHFTLLFSIDIKKKKHPRRNHSLSTFHAKNWKAALEVLVISCALTYFVNTQQNTPDATQEMLEFFIDNIVCIPMGTSCAFLLVNLFLYSYMRQSIYTYLSETKEWQTPLILHSGILMMFCQLINQALRIISH